jgi:EAL domain-containing protein (putative c-di-GMP-specific phosphodiesterase class I)
VALAPAHGNDVKRLIKCAELGLDKAKKSGRNCIRFFTPEMAARLDERLEIEQSIRDAIANESFDLHFQPLLNLRSGRLTGFEALLRLPAHGGDFVPPAVFIPLAEEMGLIDAIGMWAIRQACRTAVHWPPHLTVAVNLSPAQFLAGKVASVVADALAESGLDPYRLELEITENMLLSDADTVLAELGRLKAMGVKIAMDDFGTGYSSLRYLWRFPFDKLKIDGAFMRGLDGRDRNVEQIVRTIVALGRSLDLTVTAEGVENAHQLAFLREIDCDQVQGFLYGRPMPATDLAATILADYWRSLPVELAPPAAEPHAPTVAHAS